MELKEKAAYLKGLAEGLSFDKTTNEGKLLDALIDLCTAICTEVDGMQEDINYMNEYIEEIDEDLGDVEETLYGDDEDDFDIDDFEDEDEDSDSEDPEN